MLALVYADGDAISIRMSGSEVVTIHGVLDTALSIAIVWFTEQNVSRRRERAVVAFDPYPSH